MREDAQPRRWTWLRPILVPTLIATVVVGTAVGARAWFDTRDEIDRTTAEVMAPAIGTYCLELESAEPIASGRVHVDSSRAVSTSTRCCRRRRRSPSR